MLTRLLSRQISRAITRSITQAGAGGGATPAFAPDASFFAGSAGVAYDLSDASGVYVDSARTTLVSAAGQGIGSVTDLSGNGNHWTQATSALKALWQTTYADHDGFDDCAATSAIDFSTTDTITVVVGMRKISGVVMVAELSYTSLNPGAFYLAGNVTGDNYRANATGATSLNDFVDVATAGADSKDVISAVYKLGGSPSIVIRKNGVAGGSQATDLGARNFLNEVLNIGSRNGSSIFLNGEVYRMVVIGRALTAGELLATEDWCNATTAAY